MKMRRSLFAALVLLGTTATHVAAATTWLVPGDGSNTCTTISPNCDTIALAVTASTAGDTISVTAPSTPVTATVSLDKQLTVSGAGIGSTTVLTTAGVIAFDISANGIVIQDLTIQDGATGVRFAATSDDTEIARVAFNAQTARGVDISTGAGTPVSNVTITDSAFATASIGLRMSSNSTVTGLTISGTSFTGNTFAIYQANDGFSSTLTGLAISDCTFTNNTGSYAIYAEEIVDSTIENSTFTGGDNHIGILKFYSSNATPVANVTISGNDFSGFTGNAMDLEMIGMGLGTPGITVQGNTITKDVGTLTRAGAVFVRLHPTLSNGQVDFNDNTITATGTFGAGTAVYGVQLRGNGPVAFTGNTIDGGNVGGSGTTPPSAGIFVQSRSGGTIMPATTVITGTCNTLTGFHHGVTVFDSFAVAPGGLTAGATVAFSGNSIVGNDVAGAVNGATPTLDFESNWWGCSAGPGNPGCDAILGDVDADPALAAPPACIACAPAPLTGCRVSPTGKSQLQLKNKTPDTKDQSQWKWGKGAITPKSDFGTPLTSTDYQLCIYGGGSLVSKAFIPAGGTCAGKACWKENSKGFQYKDKEASPEGVTQLQLKEGLVAGKAQIQVKAKGDPIDMPTLPLALPVVVQLRNTDNGVCWESTHSAPASKNDTAQYKDKND